MRNLDGKVVDSIAAICKADVCHWLSISKSRYEGRDVDGVLVSGRYRLPLFVRDSRDRVLLSRS